MKRILITGANSYIGTSFETYMKTNYPDDYIIDTVDMIDGSWRAYDFSTYDTVFHVAGIAHSTPKKSQRDFYYKINTDLAVETALKAKNSRVGQFIFMSSIIVFGSKNNVINTGTLPEPENFYGDSKLQADINLQALNSESFKVASVRPPMIYGKGSKGNYSKLSSLAKKTLLFPKTDNQRSMLYIENLCGFIKALIDNNSHGYFYPQNTEYVNTSDLVCEIAAVHEKNIFTISGFSPLLRWLSKRIVIFNKLFGTFIYAEEMSNHGFVYPDISFKESIRKTEGV